MKITISSPDGLGDFILRIPMLQALRDAGHELQLFMREPAAGLAASLLPNAELHMIEADPYHEQTRKKRNPFRREQEAIHRFQPDLYVAALFSLNYIDEVWMESNKTLVPVAGFSTSDAFWPSGTICDPKELAAGFQIKINVPASVAEIEKNRLLGSAILGIDLPEIPPKLRPGTADLDAARIILKSHNLMEGEYWITCVGGRSGLKMKDWGERNWEVFFESVAKGNGSPILFLGNPKEWASIERIRAGKFRSVNLASTPPPIAVSLALATLSCGYVGRDSGVMHMTAAAGRPVLAAYGGGHWGRFFPSSGPAVVVTQMMACRMCNFACVHEQPHCVTGISMESMLAAWERLQNARGVEILEQSSDPGLDTVAFKDALEFAMKHDFEVRRHGALTRSSGLFGRLFGR